MEYVSVVFPDRREVLIDGRGQGYNRSEEGKLRIIRVNEGLHTIALGGVQDYDPPSVDVTVAGTDSVLPMEIRFEKI